MGKVVFLDLLDEGQRLQAYLRRDRLGERAWQVLGLIDLGDFAGIEGQVIRTDAGELSVQADRLTVLGKGTHPVPLSKRQGERTFDAIADEGTFYRQRHLDLIVNPRARELFVQRGRIIRSIRRYLDEEGFLEVETPIVSPAYGGAAARPFRTTVHALDEAMFLRISPECALKRLLCGGLNKVYELGRNFRNQGIDASDASHNPEFTMLEWYEAYSDYRQQMVRFETLVARLSQEVNGSTRLTYRGRPLDLTPPWRRLPMLEALAGAGVDLSAATVKELADLFARHHPEGCRALPEPLTWGAAVVELFEALVAPTLWDPVFVMDHPVEVSPLTKRHRQDPRLVERFEPTIAGMEVGNSYSELNDPVEQYERLADQQVGRDQAYDLDEEFLLAVAHGMPQAGGTGLGVDRIVMLLSGAESIREVIAFPLVGRGEAGGRGAVEDPVGASAGDPRHTGDV